MIQNRIARKAVGKKLSTLRDHILCQIILKEPVDVHFDNCILKKIGQK